MKHRTLPRLIFLFAALLVLPFFTPQLVRAQTPVVHAVLFYSPTCPHCHEVMTNVLPALKEKFAAQLDILEINAIEEEGQALYQTYLTEFQIPRNKYGVPALLVGQTVMVGTTEIENQFPDLIDQTLSQGGNEWPQLSGLQTVLEARAPVPTPEPEEDDTSLLGRFASMYARDPAGNGMAVTILGVMIVVLILVLVMSLADTPALTAKSWYMAGLPLFGLLGVWVVQNLLQTTGTAFFLAAVAFVVMLIQIVVPLYILFNKTPGPFLEQWYSWSIPLLVVAGSLVAIYLAFVETTGSAASCGPVGDCGTVQQSPYALLFGILPVGVLGLVGNLSILAAWLLQQFGPASLKRLSTLALWGMSLFGLAFSIYLTFLEPFVIGATCMWCLTSAVVMTQFVWASTPAAKAALAYSDEEYPE